jgi:hypothetical protein
MLDTGCSIPRQILDDGGRYWIPVSRYRILEAGFTILDGGCWILDTR